MESYPSVRHTFPETGRSTALSGHGRDGHYGTDEGNRTEARQGKMKFSAAVSYAPVRQADAAAAGGHGAAAALSHDVRNMLSALNLYCDLLSEPEVLTPRHRHYAEDLRLVARAGSDLLERLTRFSLHADPVSSLSHPRVQTSAPESAAAGNRPAMAAPAFSHVTATATAFTVPEGSVQNLSEELERCHNLLSALAGPSIR